jgi:hypothetical protein
MGDPRATAPEVRCVAPLVSLAGKQPQLIGPCMLVSNGDRAIACSSAELLRRAPEPLAIYTRLDGSSQIPVTTWQLGLRTGIGIIDIPPGTAFSTDVHPRYLESILATLDTRGAPAAFVTFDANFARRVISVHVDNADPTGEEPIWLATAMERSGSAGPRSDPEGERELSIDETASLDGAPLLAWMPPDPVLGRPSEVVAVALGMTYRNGALKPRGKAPLAELVGLDDLARALPWAEQTPPPRTELEEVAGEIRLPTKP